MKARNMRDLAKRLAAADAESTRQALRYITRNTTLPAKARTQAQLQLGDMPSNTRMNQVKNRCVETARGRGVFRDFRLCRVYSIMVDVTNTQYQFRLKALEGELPGVKKASW